MGVILLDAYEIGQVSTAMFLSLQICMSFGCLMSEKLIKNRQPGCRL